METIIRYEQLSRLFMHLDFVLFLFYGVVLFISNFCCCPFDLCLVFGRFGNKKWKCFDQKKLA